MHTSAEGVTFLERHEGVVLKAYRDVVGVLTIGPGLTKASGVVDPKPGMVITAEESARLTALALARNYEPAVLAEMPMANQHEFDAGVSFHWNTGAIAKASWVDAWVLGEWDLVREKMLLWINGGGRVLPGLQRRREEEYSLLRFGVYHGKPPVPHPASLVAREVVPLGPDEVAALREALSSLGYDPGEGLSGVSVEAVRAFQADHDLTVDGIIGRATLSTVQRMIDARRKVATAAVAGGGAGTTAPIAAETAAAAADFPAWAEWVAWAVVALAVARLAWLAWSYRDALAARVQGKAPGVAARLRRI
ncbi:peptidoglycan-binding protein [Albimonas sp. CAU 1670]|uniref:glycoside hydrolase family protein n=1 Tax=Albimonas sp. CAU 1670 TaxID=3032599 RepID=UPI0023DB7DF3|nr:peptidoglycan-binding protein [Albimonas sp. CAU 1670]MDF2232191.1 peptidoglycan-binding protein [Albimonas sp. CAU 1670]